VRQAWAVVVVLAMFAGCTGGFPDDAPVLGELEVGTLAPGEHATRDVDVAPSMGFLLIGFRTGPSLHLHAALRAPNSTLYDTAEGTCVVTQPAPGTWRLDVWPDAFDGALRGGKFTIRAAQGEPPALFKCRDATFPAPGRTVTVATWTLNLSANASEQHEFEQPYNATRLALATRAAPSPNETNLTANATSEPAILLAPPNAMLAPPAPEQAATRGSWRINIAAPPDRALVNWTLAVTVSAS
jgi:hypothetical protein